MKNQFNKEIPEDFMRDEYDFDYNKGKQGKYAREENEINGYVKLSPEVHKVFKTSEEVNNALMAIIAAIPKTSHKPANSL